MTRYIFVIIWVLVILMISKVTDVSQKEMLLGKQVIRTKKNFAFFAVLPLIIIAGIRQSFIDTGAYIHLFNNAPSTFADLPVYLQLMEKDPGFWLLESLIKILISQNSMVYLSILAFIHGIIIMYVYRKYSSSFSVALFLFVASTDYLSWMHNGIRQFTAVVIVFAATPLMLKKKYLPLIMVILLASTIHGSALFMIPVVFIVQGKAWNKKSLLASVVVVVAILFAGRFTNVLDSILSDTQYTNVVTDWKTMSDNGTSALRVLVYSIPTILSVIGYRVIKKEDDPIINFACNMSIVSTMIYCLSMVTSGVFVGRLPIYCSLYGTGILLPWEIKKIFTEESAKIVYFFMVVAYLIFYYYQTHFIWGII